MDDGTNESSTKRLMFQVFFFMSSCKILCKNPFNLFSYLFFYNITKIKIKSFECPKSIKNIKNDNTWNIRFLVVKKHNFVVFFSSLLPFNYCTANISAVKITVFRRVPFPAVIPLYYLHLITALSTVEKCKHQFTVVYYKIYTFTW